MKKLLLFLTICSFIQLKSQTYTVSHYIPWSTHHQNMWGPNGSPFSLNINQQLFNINQNDTTSFGGIDYIFGLPFGAQFDLTTHLLLGSTFSISGFHTGWIDVDYPVRIDLTFPSQYTYMPGDWITINSRYHVMNGWDLSSSFPQDGVIDLDLDFGIHVGLDGTICFGACDNFNIINIDVPDDSISIIHIDQQNGDVTYPCMQNGQLAFCHDTILPIVFNNAWGTGISGQIGLPYITTQDYLDSTQLCHKQLIANGDDPYAQFNIDIIQFLSAIAGILPSSTGQPILDFINMLHDTIDIGGGINIEYQLLSADLNITNTLQQDLTFDPTIWNHFTLPTAVDYYITDPNQNDANVGSGNSAQIDFEACHDLHIKYPCFGFSQLPIDIAHSLDNEFTNHTWDSVAFSLNVNAFEFWINLPFFLKQAHGDSAEFMFTPQDSVIWADSIKAFIARKNLHLDKQNINIPDSIIQHLCNTRSSIHIGPLLSWNIPLGYIPITWFNQTWELQGFNDTIFPSETLIPLPEMAINMTGKMCFEDVSGTLTVTVEHGRPPYNYSWSNGAIVNTADTFNVQTGFAPGTHYVTVTDNNGCALVGTYTITGNNPQILYQFNINNALCHGTASGSLTVNASGGTPGFTYEWSNGITTPNNDPVTAGNYSVTITDAAGCTTVGQANVVEPPTYVSLSVDSIVKVECLGGTTGAIYITTHGGTSGYVHQWSNNTTNEDPQNLASGTYTVTVTDNNGCTLVQSYTVPQVPHCCMTPNAGNDKNVCGLTTQLEGSSPSTGNNALWHYVGGPGTAIFSNPSLANSYVMVTVPGTYFFAWHEISNVCDSLDTVRITFIAQPHANAGPSLVSVCGESHQLSAQYSVSGSNGTWQILPPQTGYFQPNANQADATIHITSNFQSYYLVWTENNMGCTSSDTIRLDFHEMPMPDAGPDLATCGHEIELNVSTYYPGFWTSSNPTAHFLPDNTSDSVLVSIVAINYLEVDTFIWTAYSDYCTNYDTVLVTFSATPHAEAGTTQSICGYTTQLSADTIGSIASSAYWTCSNNGITISYTGTDPLPWNAHVSVNNPNQFFSTADYQSAYFVWHVQSGPGCQSLDSVQVFFHQIPHANAGIDTTVCGRTYWLHATTSLLTPAGQWSTLNGPGTANFIPTTNPLTMVTVSQYGIYDFIWKEMNPHMSQCYDQDTITINFLIAPEPDAGFDSSVCGKFAYICAHPTVPGGQWSGPSGIAYYVNPDDPTPTPGNNAQPCTWVRWPSENDTVTLYWTEFNGTCYGYDSVNVYFGTVVSAEILTSQADSVVCGPSYNLLSAENPSFGYGYWYDTVHNTTFTPSPLSNNHVTATIDTGSSSYYGPHHFYWITVNGSCRDTSDVLYVNFIQKPDANAGGHYWPGLFGNNSEIKTDTVCGLNYQMSAHPSFGTGLWYSQDITYVHFTQGINNYTQSHISNDSLYLTCQSCYTVFSTSTPYREFIWQENSNICSDADTLRLYFAPRPTGLFTTTMPVCRHDSSMIIAHTMTSNGLDYGIDEFHWSYPGGTLSSLITDPILSDTIYVTWPTGESHTVSLYEINRWGCYGSLTSKNVIEPQPFNPHDTIVPASCGNCNGKITLYTEYTDTSGNTNLHYYTFNWLDSIISTTSYYQDSLCSGYYYVRVNGQSFSPDAAPGTVCHDTLSIFVPDTGTVIASFDTTFFEQHQTVPYEITMVNTTYNGRKYSWRVYDENNQLIFTSTTANPTLIFTNNGCYTITLVATSKDGCIDTTTFNPLCVDKEPVFEVPNVFTPNGDGSNDVFKVHGEAIDEFEAKIYNRWGRKVYEWNDINGYWDGKITGTEASPGIYYIVIKAKDHRGKEYKYEGFLHLLREKE